MVLICELISEIQHWYLLWSLKWYTTTTYFWTYY